MKSGSALPQPHSPNIFLGSDLYLINLKHQSGDPTNILWTVKIIVPKFRVGQVKVNSSEGSVYPVY